MIFDHLVVAYFLGHPVDDQTELMRQVGGGAFASGLAFHVRYSQWRKGTIVPYPHCWSSGLFLPRMYRPTVCVYQHWQPLVRWHLRPRRSDWESVSLPTHFGTPNFNSSNNDHNNWQLQRRFFASVWANVDITLCPLHYV